MHNRKERRSELASTFPPLARRAVRERKQTTWILKQLKSQLRRRGNVPDRCQSANLTVLADCPHPVGISQQALPRATVC
jgi:hypothetical protein